MPKNKDDQKSGSLDREFESQGQNPIPGQGQQASQGSSEDDTTSTSGGRKGNFSDKDRGDESQWSPGSSGGPSDQ